MVQHRVLIISERMRGTIHITGVLFIVERLCHWSPKVVLDDRQVSWVNRGLIFVKIALLVPRGMTSRRFMRRDRGR